MAPEMLLEAGGGFGGFSDRAVNSSSRWRVGTGSEIQCVDQWLGLPRASGAPDPVIAGRWARIPRTRHVFAQHRHGLWSLGGAQATSAPPVSCPQISS
jgi:hypothetical protein